MTEPKRLGDAIAASRALHEHDFRVDSPRGTVCFCTTASCGAMRIIDHRSGQLRELTLDELFTVTAHMMEATAIGQAMQLIHGREHGLERAREVLGYPA